MNEDVILFELARPDLYPMAFEVIAVTADTLDFRLAATNAESVGAGRGQDLCVPTVDVLGVPFDRNPSLQFASALPMRHLVDYGESAPAVLQDGWMAATFGDRWSGRYGGIVDTTALDPVFDGSGQGFADLCDAADVFGSNCQACPDGGTTCLPTGGLLHLEMVAVPELTLAVRTADDIAADPACL